MHLLPVTTVSLDESERAIDLAQPPGDIVVLSFADSDLGVLAVGHARDRDRLPTLRLASLKQLRHPLSVDLYVERTAAKARFVLVRCLGGLDYWAYGLDRLSAECKANGVKLAVLPGDDRPDSRLAVHATVPAALCDELEAYFRHGGPENMRRLLHRLAAEIGAASTAPEPPQAVPRAFAWTPEHGAISPEAAVADLAPDRPLALLLVYRSTVLAGETAPIEALAAALAERALAPLVLAVASLKDPDAVAAVRDVLGRRRPDVVLTTTAFSARDDGGFVLDAAACPILQAIPVGVARDAWASSPRGLSSADLAMQVALPEADGRLLAGPIAFKEEAPSDPALAFSRRLQTPDRAGIATVADRAAAWVGLARNPRADRRLALILSDYPARGGRAGYAVGLDAPASTAAILDLLDEAGFSARRTFPPDELMPGLTEGELSFVVPLGEYRAWLDTLPAGRRAELQARWGEPNDDPAFFAGAFRFRALRAGNVLVALQPDRGRGPDRKGSYHDPDLPPTHAYLAFYLALREREGIDALIQLGTHGTTEWLPGKAVALSEACWPRLAIGPTPVVYPFIVDDPGEAAPAKRRLGAVTVGHLTPPVAPAGLDGEAHALRELVEEFSAAQVMHPRRAALVGRAILDRAESTGLAEACGLRADASMEEALTHLDAHLCDLGEVALRDGLHVFGAGACGDSERAGLLSALDGRFVPPGPAGSPSRGRLDVMPTGRNLTTFDPRAVPTRAATELGSLAAAEVVRRHLQEEGNWPRVVVMDLWASPTLRSGGEDIAHALALMGVRPAWDTATTRVIGFEIVPAPLLDHPRVDVTVRVSGAFRDTFPDQLALIDRAARALAALDEDDEWNALAAARRRGEDLARVFGGSPGSYGAGVAAQALDGTWADRDELGRTYLEGVSHAFGPGGEADANASFPRRVEEADAFVHVTDVAERGLLDGDAIADAVGGFASAAASLGRAPALYSVDTSRPGTPKARMLAEDVDRLVRGRLTNPRWIAAQLRHGWSGAAEIAQGVDALFAFAATTDAVADRHLDLVFGALFADEAIRSRLETANPAAASAIRERLADARRRGLWRSRLNSAATLLDGPCRVPEAAE